MKAFPEMISTYMYILKNTRVAASDFENVGSFLLILRKILCVE